jgi:hypothetical protein
METRIHHAQQRLAREQFVTESAAHERRHASCSYCPIPGGSLLPAPFIEAVFSDSRRYSTHSQLAFTVHMKCGKISSCPNDSRF